MARSQVSVVIVSFNTREKLRRCLGCIEPEHEVIVVDNGSDDGSAEMVRTEFPAVKLIENSGNVGFGPANNQGMELASRDLVLFLNSDCYAWPRAISFLAGVFEDPGVVAAGGKLVNPDGSLQESVAGRLTLPAVFLEQTSLERLAGRHRYWRTQLILEREGSEREIPYRSPVPTLTREEVMRRSPEIVRFLLEKGYVTQKQLDELSSEDFAARLDATRVFEVNQVMGACLMVRPVERFDERFFLYCEDTDLCLRLRKHGRILYLPGAVFTHELGSSSPGMSRWLGVARYNRGKELFFAIHRGPLACAICWKLDRLGALLRLIAYCFIAPFKKSARPLPLLWLRVLTAPLRGPDRPPRRAG
ncbi:MAG TPA: glycosyltransferase family 2 protein [Fimbriimonadaceae bacterium]|nr:glycosyltransferase family 2 protein [Fimbriimonadaceae bacterium]